MTCMRQEAVLHVFVQLLLALNHTHGRGIMHRYDVLSASASKVQLVFVHLTGASCVSLVLACRDLKLSNMFIHERTSSSVGGTVKIGDFGISKQLADSDAAASVVGE